MSRDDPGRDGTTREPRSLVKRSNFALIVWMGSTARVVLLPVSGEVTLGRAKDADVVIADESISRRHAKILVGQSVEIEDLESRNGTRVEGRRLGAGERATVRVGSTVELGSIAVFLQHTSVELGRGAQAPSRRVSDDVVVRDPVMERAYAMLDIVAESDVSLLILGETGTGKEVYAREAHRRSPRAEMPLVSLSLAALPETMVEGELFGYEKGAFTGATQGKAGLFESAHGGTIFLDEIGELTLPLQAKLLRVLETGETTRLGSLRPRVVDVRIVSATNRDLAVEVQAGRFRADLYFRLNGFVVALPPLRERPGDVDALALLFLARSAEKLRRPPPSLPDDVRQALRAHTWPGNVRELRNVIDRAVLLASAQGSISLEHLDLRGLEPRLAPVQAASVAPARRSAPEAAGAGLWSDVDALERQRILAALEACGGNQTQAAKALGIGRTTLLTKLDGYGIERPRRR